MRGHCAENEKSFKMPRCQPTFEIDEKRDACTNSMRQRKHVLSVSSRRNSAVWSKPQYSLTSTETQSEIQTPFGEVRQDLRASLCLYVIAKLINFTFWKCSSTIAIQFCTIEQYRLMNQSTPMRKSRTYQIWRDTMAAQATHRNQWFFEQCWSFKGSVCP